MGRFMRAGKNQPPEGMLESERRPASFFIRICAQEDGRRSAGNPSTWPFMERSAKPEWRALLSTRIGWISRFVSTDAYRHGCVLMDNQPFAANLAEANGRANPVLEGRPIWTRPAAMDKSVSKAYVPSCGDLEFVKIE
jgi:hypothetical protein